MSLDVRIIYLDHLQPLTLPRFTWVPITLTFSFGLKEAKSDPYQTLYELLGPLDIKVLVEYQCGLTTHLAAKRRNTPKGLQALIDGRFIVHSDTFINAIIAAATPVSQSEEDGDAKSSLEEDWDANFPDPLKYLPPRGEEPTLRDDSAYAPNPDRKEVFEGYTFIFYEKRQFETLLSPITEGRGKALYREVIPDETEVEDFVRYVKGVAGEKGLGEFEDGSEGRGVVVVRFNPVKGPGTEWFADFNRQVALYLDHRLIEQNEFLDAILGNDASGLRRPLELEPSGVMAPPPSIGMYVPRVTRFQLTMHSNVNFPNTSKLATGPWFNSSPCTGSAT
jgi:nibrin